MMQGSIHKKRQTDLISSILGLGYALSLIVPLFFEYLHGPLLVCMCGIGLVVYALETYFRNSRSLFVMIVLGIVIFTFYVTHFFIRGISSFGDSYEAGTLIVWCEAIVVMLLTYESRGWSSSFFKTLSIGGIGAGALFLLGNPVVLSSVGISSTWAIFPTVDLLTGMGLLAALSCIGVFHSKDDIVSGLSLASFSLILMALTLAGEVTVSICIVMFSVCVSLYTWIRSSDRMPDMVVIICVAVSLFLLFVLCTVSRGTFVAHSVLPSLEVSGRIISELPRNLKYFMGYGPMSYSAVLSSAMPSEAFRSVNELIPVRTAYNSIFTWTAEYGVFLFPCFIFLLFGILISLTYLRWVAESGVVYAWGGILFCGALMSLYPVSAFVVIGFFSSVGALLALLFPHGFFPENVDYRFVRVGTIWFVVLMGTYFMYLGTTRIISRVVVSGVHVFEMQKDVAYAIQVRDTLARAVAISNDPIAKRALCASYVYEVQGGFDTAKYASDHLKVQAFARNVRTGSVICEDLLKYDAYDFRVRTLLILMLMQQSQVRDTARRFKHVLGVISDASRIAPNYYVFPYLAAQIQIAEGRYVRAGENLQMALRLNPNDEQMRSLLLRLQK